LNSSNFRQISQCNRIPGHRREFSLDCTRKKCKIIILPEVQKEELIIIIIIIQGGSNMTGTEN